MDRLTSRQKDTDQQSQTEIITDVGRPEKKPFAFFLRQTERQTDRQ